MATERDGSRAAHDGQWRARSSTRRSSATSSSSSTSRRSTCSRTPSSASRRCCGGDTPASACSGPTPSSPRSSRAAAIVAVGRVGHLDGLPPGCGVALEGAPVHRVGERVGAPARVGLPRRRRRAEPRGEPVRRRAPRAGVLRARRSRGAPEAGRVLGALKRLGVQLAVDDFGAERRVRGGRLHAPDRRRQDRPVLHHGPLDVARTMLLACTSWSSSASRSTSGRWPRGSRTTTSDCGSRSRTSTSGQGFLFSVPHEVEAIDRFLEDYAIFSGKPL